MVAPFAFDRAWTFDRPVGELWAAVRRTDEYPAWWGWLREFESEGLVAGTQARAVIRAPLPYSVHVSLLIDDVVPERRVAVTVAGDLAGPARMELGDRGGSSVLRMVFDLELRDPWLRRWAVVARPLMVWAHDVVCDTGVRQFRRHAFGDAAG
ncbi:MAG: hypothetical protein U0V73_10235 [Acidimicrobiia bacterium]